MSKQQTIKYRDSVTHALSVLIANQAHDPMRNAFVSRSPSSLEFLRVTIGAGIEGFRHHQKGPDTFRQYLNRMDLSEEEFHATRRAHEEVVREHKAKYGSIENDPKAVALTQETARPTGPEQDGPDVGKLLTDLLGDPNDEPQSFGPTVDGRTLGPGEVWDILRGDGPVEEKRKVAKAMDDFCSRESWASDISLEFVPGLTREELNKILEEIDGSPRWKPEDFLTAPEDTPASEFLDNTPEKTYRRNQDAPKFKGRPTTTRAAAHILITGSKEGRQEMANGIVAKYSVSDPELSREEILNLVRDYLAITDNKLWSEILADCLS